MKLLGFVVICALVASCVALPVNQEINSEETEVGLQFEDNGRFGSIWEKVKDAVGAEIVHYETEIKAMVKKYAPSLLSELEKIKHVVVKDGKGMVTDMLLQIMKIILGWGYEDAIEYNGFTDIWHIIQELLKKLYTAVIQEVLKKLRGTVEGVDGILAGLVHIIKAFLGEKIGTAIHMMVRGIVEMTVNYGKHIVATFNALVEKYSKVFSVIVLPAVIDISGIIAKATIPRVRKIGIMVVKGVVWIVVRAIHRIQGGIRTFASSDVGAVDNGFNEIWEKVKAAVGAEIVHYETEIEAMVKKYAPRLLAELKKIKHVIVKDGKGMVIDMLMQIMKIILGWGYEDASEHNSFPDNLDIAILVREMLEAMVRMLSSLAAKIRAILGEKVDEDIDTVIRVIDQLVDRYKVEIMEETLHQRRETLNTVMPVVEFAVIDITATMSKVFIEGGWRIIMEGRIVMTDVRVVLTLVVKRAVKTIIAIIHRLAGIHTFDSSNVGAVENGFKEIWNKIKAAVHQLGDAVRDTTMKVVKEFKPQILDALQDLKKVVVRGVKTVIIEMKDAIIKVISGGQTAASDGSSFDGDAQVYGVIDANGILAIVDGKKIE